MDCLLTLSHNPAHVDGQVKQLDVEVLHYRSLLSEAREECEMWRSQALTNAEELNNAGTREARRTLEHEEEVSCLSEKIRQVSRFVMVAEAARSIIRRPR